jgi:hypothetical protein
MDGVPFVDQSTFVTNQGISCVRHKQHVRLRPDDDIEAFPEHGMIFDPEDAYRAKHRYSIAS